MRTKGDWLFTQRPISLFSLLTWVWAATMFGIQIGFALARLQ